MRTETLDKLLTAEVLVFKDFVIFKGRLLKRPSRKLTYHLLDRTKKCFRIICPETMEQYQEEGYIEHGNEYFLDLAGEEALALLEASDYERVVRYDFHNTGFIHRVDGSEIPRALSYHGCNVRTYMALENIPEHLRYPIFTKIGELIQKVEGVRNFQIKSVFHMNAEDGLPDEFFFNYKLSPEKWDQVFGKCRKRQYFGIHTMQELVWEEVFDPIFKQAIREYHQAQS